MAKDKSINKLKSLRWEHWIERPYETFDMSFYAEGLRNETLKEIGFDIAGGSFVFENPIWYRNEKLMDAFAHEIGMKIAQGKNISWTSKAYQKFLTKNRAELRKLAPAKKPPLEKLQVVFDIMAKATAYLWLAHGYGQYYDLVIKEMAEKFDGIDYEQFINDISAPDKKTAYFQMEEMLRESRSLKEIRNNYGWLKIRTGFDDEFSIRELSKLRIEIRRNKIDKKRRGAIIPSDFKKLAKELKELVFYRTFRTDGFFELLYLSRPVFMEVAKHLKIKFSDLRHYYIPDILRNETKKIS